MAIPFILVRKSSAAEKVYSIVKVKQPKRARRKLRFRLRIELRWC
jgi:hypothetical protein